MSLWDLDTQCAEYLHSFNLLPLLTLRHQSQQDTSKNLCAGDPNEVDLDVDNDASTAAADPNSALEPIDIHSFEAYGMGRLLYHPLVWRYFGRITQYESTDKAYLRCEDVLQHLLDYQTQKKSQSGHSRKFNEFDVQDFVSYLCTSLEISDLIEVGVVIQGNLHAERVALEHTVNNRYKLFVEVTKRELSQYNQQMQAYSEDVRRPTKKRRKRAPTEEAAGQDGGDEEPVTETEPPQLDPVEEQADKSEELPTSESAELTEKVEFSVHNCSAPVPEVHEVSDEAACDSTSSTKPCKKSAIQSATCTVDTSGTATASSGVTITNMCAVPFESNLTVYLPSGQPSITHSSAAHLDHSTLDAYKSGIYVIENWELQPILPYVSAAMSAASVQQPTAPPPAPVISHTAASKEVYSSSIVDRNSSSGVNVKDSQAVGRWGEALVYQYLLHASPAGSAVNWLNQVEESRACYDIILSAPTSTNLSAVHASRAHHNCDTALGTTPCGSTALPSSLPSFAQSSSGGGRQSTEYIEVKSTRYSNRNVFEISPNEWQFAAADSRVPYHIFRVFSAGDASNVKIVVVKDVLSRITEGRVKICLAI